MIISNFLKTTNDFFISINSNKEILLLILILFGIYLTEFNEYIINNSSYLFDNNLFRLVIFIIISYISGSSPALGVSLAIIMLVSMQIITSIKLKKDLLNNKF